jgi:hypothetical protein
MTVATSALEASKAAKRRFQVPDLSLTDGISKLTSADHADS